MLKEKKCSPKFKKLVPCFNNIIYNGKIQSLLTFIHNVECSLSRFLSENSLLENAPETHATFRILLLKECEFCDLQANLFVQALAVQRSLQLDPEKEVGVLEFVDYLINAMNTIEKDEEG